MKVRFLPMDVEYEVEPGQNVMHLAHEKGLHISSVCNGIPSCAECRVRVVEGESNVLPPSQKELSLIGTGYFIDQRRLSCQLLCYGDVTVDLSEQVEKSKEDPITKQFLKKANKEKAEDSHAEGGILLEQEQDMISESDGEEKPTNSSKKRRSRQRRRKRRK